MTIAEIGYVAGIVDGEGYLAIATQRRQGHPERPHYRVEVQMTDLDVLERCQRITGVGHVYRKGTKQKPHHKDAWRWMIQDQSGILQLLQTIFPLLGERRQARAKEMILALTGRS